MPGENDSENGGAWISHCIKVQTTKDLSGFLGVVSACVHRLNRLGAVFSFCAVLRGPADLRVPDPFHTMIAVSGPQLSD